MSCVSYDFTLKTALTAFIHTKDFSQIECAISEIMIKQNRESYKLGLSNAVVMAKKHS